MSDHSHKLMKARAEATYDHVLKYMGVFGGVEGLKNLLKMVKTKFATKFLLAEGCGIADKYGNIAEVINKLTSFGIGFSAIRRISEDFEERSDADVRNTICIVRTLCLWTALLGGLVCVCGAPFISRMMFGDGSHTFNLMLLALLVMTMPIEAGECALLKGTRRLKRVAAVESIAAVFTLAAVVPFYYYWGIAGVIYTLVLSQVIVTAIHLAFSVTLVPYRVQPFSRRVLKEGAGLLRVGLPFALAGLAAAFMAFAIMQHICDNDKVGLYGKGMLLLGLYASMAFTAMDADFFPRLSSVNHDNERINKLVNQQLDVCSMLLAPLLLVLLAALPVLVPLLFTHEFVGIVPMCTCAVFYTYFKGMTTPIEYIPLAKGQTLVYLLVEVVFSVVTYLAVCFSYDEIGLVGVGVAMSLTLLVELLVVYVLYHKLYGYALQLKTVGYSMLQLMLLTASVCVCLYAADWLRYAVVLPLAFVSFGISLRALGRKFSFYRRMKHKIGNRNTNCDCCK